MVHAVTFDDCPKTMHPDKIIQNYRLIRFLGDGGMGQVWLAEHTLLGRKVAVKSLHPQFARNAGIRARFKQEAATLAHLQHPAIVALHDYIEEDDAAYLVMEYVDGLPLDEYIAHKTGPIPTQQLRALFGQILDGFVYAHQKMVVHRDIKPSNFLVTEAGVVKILDFGIAKILSDGNHKLTKTGSNLGTVLYMSPEQVRGESVDLRSDIYALGVTLFQMATGQGPYSADATEFTVYDQIVNHPLPAASSIYPGVTADIEALIQKATQKLPDRRFQNCADFKAALLSPAVVSPVVDAPAARDLQKTEFDVPAPPIASRPATVVQQPTQVAVQAATAVASPAVKKKGFRIWAGVLGLVVVAAIVVAVVLNFGGMGSGAGTNVGQSTGDVIPGSPESTVRAFYDYLGNRDYRKAYELTDSDNWPSYDGFSDPNKGFGSVNGSNVNYVNELNKKDSVARVEAEAYMSDPKHGSHTFKFHYSLKLRNGEWKITDSACLNCKTKRKRSR